MDKPWTAEELRRVPRRRYWTRKEEADASLTREQTILTGEDAHVAWQREDLDVTSQGVSVRRSGKTTRNVPAPPAKGLNAVLWRCERPGCRNVLTELRSLRGDHEGAVTEPVEMTCTRCGHTNRLTVRITIARLRRRQ